jgi:serine protease Do
MKWMPLALLGLSVVAGDARSVDPQTPTTNALNLRRTIIVDVVEKSKNSVVYIAAEKIMQQRVPTLPLDPFFQQFDPGQIRTYRSNSLGSGFVLHADGYIATNNHVVSQATQITVEMLDGRKLPAHIISADAQADIAILKVDSESPLPALELGDSSDLMIGEPVIAVGNPLGFSHSVSTGIVSANHRDLQGPNNEVLLGDLIQTDAAINPGNSGGPLLNAYGQVIGINTAIRRDAQNLGFAIQVNKLRDMIPDLLNPSQVTKVEIPLMLKEKRSLTPPASVLTTVLSADGKAIDSIAGVKPRDIVDAYAILLKQKPQADFEVAFADGSKQTVSPTAVPQFDAMAESQKRLGLVVETVTDDLAQQYSLEVRDGMFVTKVMRESPAFKAGIRPGDVILQLGRFRVRSLEDYSALMQMLPKGQGRVPFFIVRGDATGRGFMIVS